MGDAALVYEGVGGVAAILLVAALLFVAVRRIQRKPAKHSEYQLVTTNEDLYKREQTVPFPTQVGFERDEEKGLLQVLKSSSCSHKNQQKLSMVGLEKDEENGLLQVPYRTPGYGGINTVPNKNPTYGDVKTVPNKNPTYGDFKKSPYKNLTYGDIPRASSETNIFAKVGRPTSPMPAIQRTRHQCNSTTSLDSLDDPLEDIDQLDTTSHKHQTCIEFYLVWVSLESSLTVCVTRITNLPPKLCKQFTATITLTLQSDTREFPQTVNKEHKGLNPEINHLFTFTDVSLEEIKSSLLVLQLSVRRRGHLRRKSLGELSYSLGHINLLPDNPVTAMQPLISRGPASPNPWNQAGRRESDEGNVGGTAHQFAVHTYKSPTFCVLCSNLLYGIVKQGMQCQVCKMNIHIKCQMYARATCGTDATHIEESNPEDSDVVVPHQFQVHSYKSPTGCAYCGAMLYGMFKQGMQCQVCGMNIHNKCEKNIKSSCCTEQDLGRPRLLSADGMSDSAVGEVLVLLQYQITSHTQGRVKVFIRKAKAIIQGKGSVEYSVNVVVHRSGETVEVHQTSEVAGPEPVWNAPFIFDVRQDQIKEYWIELFLQRRGRMKLRSTHAIGRALLGLDTTPQGTQHWENICANLDKEVTNWHNFFFYQDNS